MVGFTWQFGERFRQIRKAIRVNQEEFGELLGVSRQTINAYENNRQRPTLDMMEKVCGLQEISPYWLLSGIGDFKASGSYPTAEEYAVPLGVAEDRLLPEQRALINFILEDSQRAKRMTYALLDRSLGKVEQ